MCQQRIYTVRIIKERKLGAISNIIHYSITFQSLDLSDKIENDIIASFD